MILIIILTFLSLLKLFLKEKNYADLINLVSILACAFTVSFSPDLFTTEIWIHAAYLIVMSNIDADSLQENVLFLLVPLVIYFIKIENFFGAGILPVLALFRILTHNRLQFLILFLLGMSLLIFQNSFIALFFVIMTFYFLLSSNKLNRIVSVFMPILVMSMVPGIELSVKYVIVTFMVFITYFFLSKNKFTRLLTMSFSLMLFFDQKYLLVFILIVALEYIMFFLIKKYDKSPIYQNELLCPQVIQLSTVFFLVSILNIGVPLFCAFLLFFFISSLFVIYNIEIKNILINKSVLAAPFMMVLASGFYYNSDYSYFGLPKLFGVSPPRVSLWFLLVFIIPAGLVLIKKYMAEYLDSFLIRYILHNKYRFLPLTRNTLIRNDQVERKELSFSQVGSAMSLLFEKIEVKILAIIVLMIVVSFLRILL